MLQPDLNPQDLLCRKQVPLTHTHKISHVQRERGRDDVEG